MSFRSYKIIRVISLLKLLSGKISIYDAFKQNGICNRKNVQCLVKSATNFTNSIRKQSAFTATNQNASSTKTWNYSMCRLPLKLQTQQQRNYSIEKQNKKKVREMNDCETKEKQQKPKLAFRQTTKEECKVCTNIKVTSCPNLGRPKRLYDPSKMTYHCRQDRNLCDIDPPRMDKVLGLKVVEKELPRILKSKGCIQCDHIVPKISPKLVKLKKRYDDSKQKYKFKNCDYGKCNIDPPRMDNISGYKIVPKSLPTIKSTCLPCTAPYPKKAPKLKRPKPLYDASKMKYICPKIPICDVDPPRIDNVVGFEIVRKCLPKLKALCKKCVPPTPTYLPKLGRPEKLYDASKMEHKHCVIEKICDVDPPRMDIVRKYKIQSKILPELPVNKCGPCTDIVPKSAPKLKRPTMRYKPEDVQHECVVGECKLHRMDFIKGYKIVRRKLPKPPLSECKKCAAFVPRTCPKLIRPKKLYDESKMKRSETCGQQLCDIDPPRMDKVRGFKTKRKSLPKLRAHRCQPCTLSPPTKCPKLVKLPREYDPSKMKHVCLIGKDKCNIDPPRMDKVLGLKIKSKELPPPPLSVCIECENIRLRKGPKLCPPVKRCKISETKCNIEDKCNIDPPRMDNVKGYKIMKKKLPKLKVGECRKCEAIVPRKGPKLRRPKRKFDPSKMKYRHTVCPRTDCGLNPPRMDDVLCWSPKAKKLPSFNTSGQKRHYSSYFNKRFHQKGAQFKFFKNYSSKSTFNCKTKKKKSKPKCSKFKVKPCKPPARSDCLTKTIKSCTKLNSPYESAGECMDDPDAPKLTECSETATKMLQPRYQTLPNLKKILVKQTIPKIKFVDPEVERKYMQHKCSDEESEIEEEISEKKCKKNQCPSFKLKRCKRRARHTCILPAKTSCNKIRAPYESFSELSPEFPDLEYTECDLADKFANESRVDYSMVSSSSDKEIEIKEPEQSIEGKKSICVPIKEVKEVKKSTIICKRSLPKPTKRRSSKKKTTCECSTKSTKRRSSKKTTCKSTTKPTKRRSSKTTTCNCLTMKPLLEIKTKPACVVEKKELNCWERLCAYFKARPDCPPPDEWKKKQLREKAEKAAAAAGMKLCEKKKNVCKINSDPCKSKQTRSRKSRCKTKTGRHLPPPTKCKRNYSTYSILTRNSLQKSIQKKINFESNFEYSKTGNKDIYCPKIRDYQGRIYRLKLTKIGIRNALIKTKNEDVPYSYCHICKLIPKSLPNRTETNPEIKNVKTRRKSDRNKTCKKL